MWETWVLSLVWKVPWKRAWQCILACRIPMDRGAGGLQSMGLQRNWAWTEQLQAYLPLEYQLLFVLESFMYGHYVLVLFLSTLCLYVVHVAIDTHSSFIFIVLYSVVWLYYSYDLVILFCFHLITFEVYSGVPCQVVSVQFSCSVVSDSLLHFDQSFLNIAKENLFSFICHGPVFYP